MGHNSSQMEKLEIGKPMNAAPVIRSKGTSWDPDLVWNGLQKNQIIQEPIEAVGKKHSDSIRFVCLSDTHGKHRDVAVPDGDVILHAGDITNTGELKQLEDFELWLSELPHAHKIVIAGNHDVTIPEDYYNEVGKFKFHSGRPNAFDPLACRDVLEGSPNITYLEDSMFELDGICIWGSPWQPEFGDWAFNLPRGEPLREKWSKIPTNVDILITHGPSLGRCDLNNYKQRTGCADLLEVVQGSVKPSVHLCGHIHEAHGRSWDGQTLYINASNCNRNYRCTQPAIVFDIKVDAEGKAVGPPVVIRSEVTEWTTAQVKEWVDKYRESSSPNNSSASDRTIWPDSLCDLIEKMNGQQLLEIDYSFIREELGSTGTFQSIRSQIEFIKEIRKLEAANM